MRISRRQLRKIIRESINSKKDYHRVWSNRKWSNSPDWQALEDALIAMGREEVARMLPAIADLGGTLYTFPEIQAAADAGDNEALDQIVARKMKAFEKQSSPRYGRY